MEGNSENILPGDSLPDSQQASEASENAPIPNRNNTTTPSAAHEETIDDTSDTLTETNHIDLNNTTNNSNNANSVQPHSVNESDVDNLTSAAANGTSAPINAIDSETSKSSTEVDLSSFKLSKNLEHLQVEQENEQENEQGNEQENEQENEKENEKENEQENEQACIEENHDTLSKDSSIPKEEMPHNNATSNELPSSAFFKINKKFSLHEEPIEATSSAPKVKNSGSFYLQVKGLLEVLNMDELKTQLAAGGVEQGTSWERNSTSIRAVSPKMNKSRSTSVPVKAITKNASNKDSGHKRIVKKPEVLNRGSGLSKTSITIKKGQMPPPISTARQTLKKPHEIKSHGKNKPTEANYKMSARVLSSKQPSANEEKSTPTNKEKTKATFFQMRKESLQDKNTKSTGANGEKSLIKTHMQVKPLPPKELITKFKTPAKALPRQFIPLNKQSLEQKDKSIELQTSPKKETVRNVTTPVTKHLIKKNASTPSAKFTTRNRTVALEEFAKKETSKPTSSSQVDLKKPVPIKTKTLESVKAKERRKSIKENITPKRLNSIKHPLKKQGPKTKLSSELSKNKSKEAPKGKYRTGSKSSSQQENILSKMDTTTPDKKKNDNVHEEEEEHTENEQEQKQIQEEETKEEHKENEQQQVEKIEQEQNYEDDMKEKEQTKHEDDVEEGEEEEEAENKETEDEKEPAIEGEEEENKSKKSDDTLEEKAEKEENGEQPSIFDTADVDDKEIGEPKMENEKEEALTTLKEEEEEEEEEERKKETEIKPEEEKGNKMKESETQSEENVEENESKPEEEEEEEEEEKESEQAEVKLEETVEEAEAKPEETVEEAVVKPETKVEEPEDKLEDTEKPTIEGKSAEKIESFKMKYEEYIGEDREKSEEKIESIQVKYEEKIEEERAKSEEILEEHEAKPEENTEEVELKIEDIIETPERIEGKTDAPPISDRKKSDRKKSERKKSVDMKLVKRATPKIAIAAVKKPEFKVKLGFKSKATIKNVLVTSPVSKSDANGTPKDKKDLKKIATKDASKSGNSRSLTLRKVLTAKKVSDIKKTALAKSETKDASTEKRKLEEPTERTTIKVSAKGSMKITVKATHRSSSKAPAKAETKPLTKAETKAITKAETKAITKAETKAITKAEAKATTKAEAKATTKAEAKAITKAETKAITKAETKAITKATTTKLLSKIANKEVEKKTSLKKIPETEKAVEMESGLDMITASTEKDPEITSVQNEETAEKDADKESVKMATTSLSTSKLMSSRLNSSGGKSKPVKSISLKGLKLKKTLSKRSNLEKNKPFNVGESNTYRSMLQGDKGSIPEIEPEIGTYNKSKEFSASISSKRSLKSKKSASSKYSKKKSGSVLNNSMSKKNSSVSDTKSKKSTSRNKTTLDSSKKGSFSKGKMYTASKVFKPLKKMSSKLTKGTSFNIEDDDSFSKKRLRKSKTKRESLKSSSFNSTNKSEAKLKRNKTETLTKKSTPDLNKLKEKKKTKKENITPTSDNELSSRFGAHISSGVDSPNKVKSEKSIEKNTSIPKIGITNTGSTGTKKTKGGKHNTRNILSSLPNHTPKSLYADKLPNSGTTPVKSKKKKMKESSKKKKGKSTNLLNETLEEEMKRIIQDNTMLLAEQTDEDIREELLNKEKNLIECKNAVSEKKNDRTHFINRRVSAMSKPTVGLANETHMSSFTYANMPSYYPYRSGSVGSGIRNTTISKKGKPFTTKVLGIPRESYIIQHPNEISIDAMRSSGLMKPSPTTGSWLFNKCCCKNTLAEDEPVIVNGRNEPMLKDFSSLLNAENKYIPYTYMPQIESNPPQETLKMSNLYDHNVYKNKMNYFSSNILPLNTSEPMFPNNPKNLLQKFSVKIKKFPDSTPTRASCNCL